MTIQHEQALAVIEQVSPRMFIPMHFGFIVAAERLFELAKKLYPIKSEAGATIFGEPQDSSKRNGNSFFFAGWVMSLTRSPTSA